MACELACEVLWAPQITVQDAVVTAACAQESVVPGDGADTALMATHGLH